MSTTADGPGRDRPGPERVPDPRDEAADAPRATGTTAPLDAPLDPAVTGSTAALDRKTVVAREKEQFGGYKIGSAFFGWLTATGTAVLLIALLTAAGTALSFTTGLEDAAADQDATTIGLAGGIALLVVLFLAYLCGGYVAGRMARFNGALQGVAVWVWGIVITIVVAVVGAVAGDRYDVFARLDLPRIPVGEGDVTTGAIIALLAAAGAALAGAVLGGLAGMRYHRRVDRAGLGG